MAGPTRSPYRQWETIPEIVAQPMLLTPGSAERLTGLRAETLRVYSRQPGGPSVVKISSRRVMYDRADLLAWLERRTERVPSTAPTAVTEAASDESIILEAAAG
jgi:predicted DNA-binding transcriptional regulator AlpA